MNVAIIDDSRSVVAALIHSLNAIDSIFLHGFLDPADALLAAKDMQFDLVLVDYTMPRINGAEVIGALRADPRHASVPIIMLTSETDNDVKIKAISAGATEFVAKPVDPIELRARAINLLALRRAQMQLESRASDLEAAVKAATAEIAAREEEIIWRLARAIEFKDGHTGNHVTRVADISRIIALEMGLTAQQAHMIYLAAPLHDVGKIGISDALLGKPGRLSAEEYAQMQQHVEFGVQILGDASTELLKVACAIAGGHHEKWDGSGYPNGLVGDSIPQEARVVAIADVFEALCSERPYKKAWSLEAAYNEIVACSGTHFDPECVAAFSRQWRQICRLMGSEPAAAPASTPPSDSVQNRVPEAVAS
ncbi:two-component system response regulator [Metarhizobium album]|uniref:Two-component system response regulator n=1 Tax=Metarhizobium album TaxID=2182425 RepID=A0A2U2DIC5_9HYPH|nr:HD domain-containing phosphohydrolase [Rhizobium album]PWE53028.1 two-component system response regulator [Rhizobium album]